MKKILSLFLTCALLAGTGLATDITSFNKVKVSDAKGKQTDAQMLLNDSEKKIVVRVADKDFVVIPYENLDKASYEYSKKHRVTQGAVVMVASLGAGAIVMLTKSKSHWLYLDFHEGTTPKSIVLRMDKGDYKEIMAAVKTHTGKEVLDLGDEKNKDKKVETQVADTKKTDEKKSEDKQENAKPAEPKKD